MDGLSRWDLVLWIVVAYVAVTTMVRMMLNHREVVIRRLRDQLTGQKGHKTASSPAEERREAA